MTLSDIWQLRTNCNYGRQGFRPSNTHPPVVPQSSQWQRDVALQRWQDTLVVDPFLQWLQRCHVHKICRKRLRHAIWSCLFTSTAGAPNRPRM